MLSDLAGCAKNSRADGIADDYGESEHDSQYGEKAPRRSGDRHARRLPRLHGLGHARGVSRDEPVVASGLAMKSASSSWKWWVPTSRRSEYRPRS